MAWTDIIYMVLYRTKEDAICGPNVGSVLGDLKFHKETNSSWSGPVVFTRPCDPASC